MRRGCWPIAAALLVGGAVAAHAQGPPSQAIPVPAIPVAQAWATFQDPQEGAFSLDVPQNWQVQGGTARRNALQFRNWVQAVAPDGDTIIAINDPTEGSYVAPSQMLAMAGFAVGSLYSGGGGTLYRVEPYQTGAQFAASWGQRKLASFCTGVTIAGGQELPALTASVNAAESAFGLHHDAGEADFTCTRGGVSFQAHVLANVLAIVGAGGTIWYEESLVGWVAPAPLAGVAAGVLAHMVQSVRVNPDWVRRVLQTNLDVSRIATETNRAISSTIMQSWTDRGAVMDRVMAEDSRARLGIDIYRDPATGTTYTVSNTHNFYWANAAGRVVGTETDTPPPGFSKLTRVPPTP